MRVELPIIECDADPVKAQEGCKVEVLGDTLTVDLSDVETCACGDGDEGTPETVNSYTEVRNLDFPTEWICTAVAEDRWRSESAGYFDLWRGATCSGDDLSEYRTGCSFLMDVRCVEEAGEPTLVATLEVSVPSSADPTPAFLGRSPNLGEAIDNEILICRTIDELSPFESLRLFTGGTATISAGGG